MNTETFFKYDFECYKLWCLMTNKKAQYYNNLMEYKKFLKSL